MRIALRFAATAARTKWVERFADDSGGSLIEYALIVALVSALGIAGLKLLGTSAKATLSSAAAFLP
jgi:Flp pilus assembly pilin Flp